MVHLKMDHFFVTICTELYIYKKEVSLTYFLFVIPKQLKVIP